MWLILCNPNVQTDTKSKSPAYHSTALSPCHPVPHNTQLSDQLVQRAARCTPLQSAKPAARVPAGFHML